MKSVYFNNIHALNDVGLVLTEVDIPPAIPKTKYVDVPASDGSVDLSLAFGRLRYKDRDGTLKFTLLPEMNQHYEEVKSSVSAYFGMFDKVTVVLEKDPEHYYLGRCYVSEYESDKNLNQITVKAILNPFRYKMNETVQACSSGTNKAFSITLDSGIPVIPTIKTTASTTINFKNNSYMLNAGTHKILDIELQPFISNDFVITSTGTTTFSFQERDL